MRWRFLSGLAARAKNAWQLRDNERGSMLLVALGILTLLTVMSIAFVTQMSLEKKASLNYVDGVKARLIAEGGMARSLEEMRQEVAAQTYSSRAGIFAKGNFWLPLEVTSDIVDPVTRGNDPYAPSFLGILGQSYTGGVDRYKVKVIDTQAQFNLNCDMGAVTLSPQQLASNAVTSVYEMVLKSLGSAIGARVASFNSIVTQAATQKGLTDFEDLLFPLGDPFERAEFPKLSDEDRLSGRTAVRGVKAIIALRASKEGQKFRSKSGFLECMSAADFRLVRDFVTAKSWVDPKTLQISDSTDTNIVEKGSILGRAVLPGVESGTGQNALESSSRAPININLASEPVLLSMLAPLGGRRAYIHTVVNENSNLYKVTDVDSSYNDMGRIKEPVVTAGSSYTQDPNAREAAYGTRRFLVYLPPLGYYQPTATTVAFKPVCENILNAITARRDDPTQGGPFKNFADWDEFVEEKIWPILSTIDPAAAGLFDPIILEFDEATGSAKQIPSALKSEVVASLQFKTWFRRSYIGILKSALNPNDRFSQRNPPQAMYVEVDKGNIKCAVSQIETNATVQNTNTDVMSVQTCEWCFASKGVFEIISLGELVNRIPAQLLTDYGMVAPAAANDPSIKPEVHAQSKVRTIIRIFDEITHSSQREFATNGHTGIGKFPGNENVVGFPIVDSEDPTLGYLRRNMRSYPVDEKLWWSKTTANDQSGRAYDPNEVAGFLNDTGSGRQASAGMGALMLATRHITRGTLNAGGADDFPIATNGYADAPPYNLFELRFDHSRNEQAIRSLYSAAGLSDPLYERISRVVADVAAGVTLSGSADRRPNDFRHYVQRPPTTFHAPLLPSNVRNWSERWLKSGGASDQWYQELVVPDGIYLSDHHKRHQPVRNGGSPLTAENTIPTIFFPTFRAMYEEPLPVSDVAIPGETLFGRYCRKIGVGGANGVDKDWPNQTNIQATRGVITFWYKPDFDWNDATTGQPTPRYCGFFTATALARPRVLAPAPQTGTTAAAEGPTPASGGPGPSPNGRLSSHSWRGTQMHFMRMPTGEMRVVRMYFELAGAATEDAEYISDLNLPTNHFLRQIPRIMNPWFGYAGAKHGSAPTGIYTTPYVTLNKYLRWLETYFTVLYADIASGAVNQSGYVYPPYLPYPPKELYLPKNAQEFLREGLPTSVATEAQSTRLNIDKQFNRQMVYQARYDIMALRTTNNLALLDLRAGRWYHMTVTWDDARAGQSVGGQARRGAILIDGVELEAEYRVRGELVGVTRNYEGYDWGALNGSIDQRQTIARDYASIPITSRPNQEPDVRETNELPKFVQLNDSLQIPVVDLETSLAAGHLQDSIIIGGVYRRQASAAAVGVFKHRQGKEIIAIPCNGTIDDFCVVRPPEATGTPQQRPILGVDVTQDDRRDRFFWDDGARLGGYWTQWVKESDGLFTGTTTNVKIIGVTFTGYMPYVVNRTGGLSTVRYLDDASIRVQVFTADKDGGTSSVESGAAPINISQPLADGGWLSRSNRTELEESSVPLLNGPINLGKTQRLIYRVIMAPGRDQPVNGVRSGEKKAVATPVLDSITFVYQLPQSEILLSEQVFD